MKKFYLFMIMMLAAVVANATTLSLSVYQYDESTNESVAAESPVSVEAEIDGASITLPNFLGSESTLSLKAYTDGSVDHNSGDFEGTYSFGSFGDYETLYIYDDYGVEYYTENGVQTIWIGLYAGPKGADAWFDLYLALPDDYTPEQAADPYEGLDTVTLPVTLYDGDNGAAGTQLEVKAIIDGGTVTILGLFGVSQVVYTIDEEGNITSNASGYLSGNYTCNGISNSYIYFYGNQYLKYTADTKVIRDYVYMYYSTMGIYYDIQLPESFDPAAVIEVKDGLNINVYDYESSSYGDSVVAAADIEGGVVTFENFLGADNTLTVTCYDDGSVTLAVDGVEQTGNYATLTGDIDAGTWQYDQLKIYIPYCDYDIDSKGKYLTLTAYGYVGEEKQWIFLYVLLPDDFEPEAVPVPDSNVTVYSLVDNEISGEGIETYIEYTVSGSTVTIKNPFGSSGFTLPFVMQNDGTVTSTGTLGGYYTKNYTLNDKTYTRLHDNGREYDLASHTFIWTIALSQKGEDIEDFVVYIPLGEDFTPSEPQILESYTVQILSTNNGTVYKPLAKSYSVTAEISKLADREITLTKVFDKTVSVKVAWDENGAVSVDGTFSRQYYSFNSDYYTTIAIDSENSQYVKNDEDEYIDLAMSITGAHYGASDYPNVKYRIYLVKNSADADLITVYIYEYDLTTGEYGELEDSSSHYYEIDGARLTIKNFLDSDIDLTIHYFDDGTAESNIEAGAHSGTFYAFGNTYSTLTYGGDAIVEGEDTEYNVGYYADGRTNYGYFDFDLDGTGISTEVALPERLVFDEATGVANIAVDANAAVEYFNLQGVRVNNPENGIFIRRQGNKVQKVVVK